MDERSELQLDDRTLSVGQRADSERDEAVSLPGAEVGLAERPAGDTPLRPPQRAATASETVEAAPQTDSPESDDYGQTVRGEASSVEAAAEGSNMASLMAGMDDVSRTPRRGDVVEGTVVRIDKDGIMVDIGTKSEGVIPGHDAQGYSSRGEEPLRVGDEVLVYVVQPENQDGHVVLSLRKARSERGWRTAQRQLDEGSTVESEVIDYNRGGLIVDVDGVRGFVPMSQVVGLRHDSAAEGEAEAKLAAMVGRKISLKVLELNRRRNRLILSERSAVQELRSQRKDQLLSELQEGQIRHGKVSSLCDFGAFIDLGGADGLVHLSELSWSQVAHPRDVVNVGDELDVYVLGVDREKKKIALSLRRGQAEPWSKVADKYHIGDQVTGKITKLVQFGAFARIEDGIEGLIHVSELADGRIQHPKNIVQEGDVLTLRVIRIDPDRRRLGLSLKQVEQPDDPIAAPEQATSAEQVPMPSSNEGETDI